jgi:hypothetical protein
MKLQTLHLANFHPHTFDLSDDLAAQLDRAFFTAFPAEDLLDPDLFPAWKRVAVEAHPAGGERWLLRYSGLAMIWVEIGLVLVDDLPRLLEIVRDDLAHLHEGNAARYGLRPSEVPVR